MGAEFAYYLHCSASSLRALTCLALKAVDLDLACVYTWLLQPQMTCTVEKATLLVMPQYVNTYLGSNMQREADPSIQTARLTFLAGLPVSLSLPPVASDRNPLWYLTPGDAVTKERASSGKAGDTLLLCHSEWANCLSETASFANLLADCRALVSVNRSR